MQKLSKSLVALSLLMLGAAPASAQELKLPVLSPRATVSQVVGINTISIDYSSPGLRGRAPFGELVPFNEVWRAGANASTKITFTDDAKVAGKDVSAGTYSLFFIPTAKTWTVILNSDKDASPRSYDEKKDVVRAVVKTEKAPKRERMLFLFANTTDEGTRIDMEWDQLRVSIPVTVDTMNMAKAGIDAHVDGAWGPLARSARYYADTVKDSKRAMELIDMSLAIKTHWYNMWFKAKFLADAGKFKDAYPLADKAFKLGNEKPDRFFFKDEIEKALSDWKSKI